MLFESLPPLKAEFPQSRVSECVHVWYNECMLQCVILHNACKKTCCTYEYMMVRQLHQRQRYFVLPTYLQRVLFGSPRSKHGEDSGEGGGVIVETGGRTTGSALWTLALYQFSIIYIQQHRARVSPQLLGTPPERCWISINWDHVIEFTHVAVLCGCSVESPQYFSRVMSKAVSCGRDITCVPDLSKTIQLAGQDG